MAYYEPTVLFRQNAIRRPNSPQSSVETLTSPSTIHSSNRASAWLMNLDNGLDACIMNKVCSLDRSNIKSNYWKVPDAEMHLTSLAVNDPELDAPLLAILSASSKNNLFIYELDSINQYLTHHTTISLPDTHGLAWVPNTNSKYIVSGNSKGYAHLISIPRPLSYEDLNEDESAEIVKRFNHRKHLKLVNKDPSLLSHTKTCVSQLSFIANDKLASIYDDTLFIWNINGAELSMRPRPEAISVIPGLTAFDAQVSHKNTVALCGSFGVSLFDPRSSHHSVPKSPINPNSKSAATNMVKWHSSNENILASSHGDGVVRLWDIRKQDSFAQLTGHRNKCVTSMSWNGDDLFTGASDGNVVFWDLSSGMDAETELSDLGEGISHCSLKEGLDSVAFDKSTNTLLQKVNERQCGTLLPASNNQIIGMSPLRGSGRSGDCKVILVDASAFLGLHSRIHDASSCISSEKTFLTSQDMDLLRAEASTATLIDTSATEADLLAPEKSHKSESEGPGADATESFAEVQKLEFAPISHVDDWDSKSVVTLHSIESLPEFQNSPYGESLHNDSDTSLSTVTTFTELNHVDQGMLPMSKEPLTTFLDLELERLCDRFPDSLP